MLLCAGLIEPMIFTATEQLIRRIRSLAVDNKFALEAPMIEMFDDFAQEMQ